MQEAITMSESKAATPERLGRSLYWRGGKIYARLTMDGRRTFRSTNTDDPVTARQILKEWRIQQVLKAHGMEPAVTALDRNRLTVGKVLDAYIAAGLPTRKMRQKAQTTIKGELYAMRPVRSYFGERAAVALTLADCDKYRDWRNSGGYVVKRTLKSGKQAPWQTRGGDRGCDVELIALGNALQLAVRRGQLKRNPLAGRTNYGAADKIRHCREVAPTPEGLAQIEHWLRLHGEDEIADAVCFLACSGLRISEAMALEWEAVDWSQGVLHVKRAKRGCNPFVPLLPELVQVLRGMQKRQRSFLLFPSPFDPQKPDETPKSRDISAVRRRITAACKALGLAHVAPHGLRSYFVTQARQSGLTDAEIAALIGDKSGPAIIASTYGDVPNAHLMNQAQRIKLRATGEVKSLIPQLIPVGVSVSNSADESLRVSAAA